MKNRLNQIRAANDKARADDELRSELADALAPTVPTSGCEHQRAVGAPCSRCWERSSGVTVDRAPVGERLAILDLSARGVKLARDRARAEHRPIRSTRSPYATVDMPMSPLVVATNAACDVRHVYRAIKNGELRAELAVAGNRRFKIARADADAWVRAREVALAGKEAA